MGHGKIDLDAPAKTYMPILGSFGIIEKDQVDLKTGDLKRPPTKPNTNVTIRHLLLHTAGFAYTITDDSYEAISTKHKLFKPSRELFDPLYIPLLFEPRTKWKYGLNFDWLGLIVESVSGQNLSEFLQENVFSKAGMTSCTFQMNDPSQMVSLHEKTKNELRLFKAPLPIPLTSEVDMGGHGCFGTAEDYLKFLRIWLNYGVSPDTGTRILSRKTVEYAMKNHLPPDLVIDFPTPSADISDGFSLIGCAINAKALKTGRPAGSLFWVGLANLYFWLDFENGIAGFWASQIMPYMEKSCVESFQEFETAVYEEIISL